jgi:transposase
MREMPMSKVAEAVGETDTRLWRMLFRQVDAAYAEADFSNVCCVGVDEMSVRKGHEYISVFADLVRKRVLFATGGKDQETWLKFVAALEKHNGHRHAISQVSMDMSPAYQRGVADTVPPPISSPCFTSRRANSAYPNFNSTENSREPA